MSQATRRVIRVDRERRLRDARDLHVNRSLWELDKLLDARIGPVSSARFPNDLPDSFEALERDRLFANCLEGLDRVVSTLFSLRLTLLGLKIGYWNE